MIMYHVDDLSRWFWYGVATGALAIVFLLALIWGVRTYLDRRRPAPERPQSELAPPTDVEDAVTRQQVVAALSAPSEESLESPAASPGPVLHTLRFGKAELVEYREHEYVEPLRCSTGLRCGGRSLVEGETFWAVPVDAHDFLVICAYCTVIPPVPVDDPATDQFEEVARGA